MKGVFELLKLLFAMSWLKIVLLFLILIPFSGNSQKPDLDSILSQPVNKNISRVQLIEEQEEYLKYFEETSNVEGEILMRLRLAENYLKIGSFKIGKNQLITAQELLNQGDYPRAEYYFLATNASINSYLNKKRRGD